MTRFYRKKTNIVEAYQLTEAKKVKTAYGMLNAKATDWVLTHTSGNVVVMVDEIFQMNYEPLFQRRYEE